MNPAARLVTATADLFLAPLTLLGGWWLRQVRRVGLHRMPVSHRLLGWLGVLPVRRHYYEPYLADVTRAVLTRDRLLPAIDLNVEEQLALLARLRYEVRAFPFESPGRREFHYHNGAFESGDAEFLYSMVRHYRPRHVIEIGSGSSTLVVRAALARNAEERPEEACRHVCIEPFEQPWLEDLGVEVVRERVENVAPMLFDVLEAGDILFIDSSHVIRPEGDVLHEYLQLLPRLRPGVLVHIHDVFTPRHYLISWLLDEQLLWNEQYLVEAFLSFNREFRILGALNYLKHHHPDALGEVCPVLREEQEHREPGSLWLVRN